MPPNTHTHRHRHKQRHFKFDRFVCCPQLTLLPPPLERRVPFAPIAHDRQHCTTDANRSNRSPFVRRLLTTANGRHSVAASAPITATTNTHPTAGRRRRRQHDHAVAAGQSAPALQSIARARQQHFRVQRTRPGLDCRTGTIGSRPSARSGGRSRQFARTIGVVVVVVIATANAGRHFDAAAARSVRIQVSAVRDQVSHAGAPQRAHAQRAFHSDLIACFCVVVVVVSRRVEDESVICITETNCVFCSFTR